MYNNQPYYGYQPQYYGVNGSMPDNLTQLRMNQGQMQTPVVAQPTPSQQQAQAQPNSGLIWVQGEAGAKSYLVAPGNTVMLMDSEGERFYLKSADASGMPMPLRIFEYKETNEANCKASSGSVSGLDKLDDRFVTREEFERRIASIGSQCKCKENAKKE